MEAIIAKRTRCKSVADWPVPIVIDAEESVPFAEVVQILDDCMWHGIKDVEFAPSPLTRRQ